MIGAICATVAVVVLGAYALTWRIAAWQREDARRLESDEKIQCPALKKMNFGKGAQATVRCELEEGHLGPHTVKLDGYMREHWE